MRNRTLVAGLVALALIVGVAAGVWYEVVERPSAFCQISGRPIRANMLTLVEVNGKRLYACCARCALTLAVQTHKNVRILQVADYASGKRIPASDAYFVDGSRMEMCSTPRVKFEEGGTPYVRLFDRCAPSLIAFAYEQDAQEFIGQFGGQLKRLGQLIAELSGPQKKAGAH